AQIENEDIRPVHRDFTDAELSQPGFHHLIARAFKRGTEQAPDLHLVVDDEHDGWRFFHGECSSVFTGSVSRNSAPPWGRCRAVASPPWAVTNPRAMARPSPDPPAGTRSPRENF